MSVIQTLRGKGSVVVTIMLILALVAFIFMDSFQNNIGAIFQQDRTMVAEVNGERVETQKYSVELQEYEEAMKNNQQKESFTDEELEAIRQQFWDQKLSSVLIGQETESLGIQVTEKERNSMFTSMDADQVVKQNFTDPETGIFDPNRVIQYEQQVIQGEDVSLKKSWGKFKTELVKQRKVNKYVNMIKMGIYAPKFMMDEMAKQQHISANISYVKVPYEAAAQNITVSDAEIKEFMKQRTSNYIIDEDAVNMDYVSFPIIPTSKDSSVALNFVVDLKEKFASSEDPYDFASNQSDELTDDRFYNTNTMKNSNKEILLAAAIGEVVGPYYDNGMYKISRVTERKTLPDSVKASHILIQPSETMTDAQAKSAADSIEKQVQSGANFAALATARSADQGSAQKGGDVGYFARGMMVPEFEKYCFEGKTGDIGVVKSQFGYHVIKITDQKAFQPNVRVATLAKLLEPSQETNSKAQQLATDFATKAKDEKTFNDAAKKMGMDKRIAQNVKSTQGIIQGLGNVRNLVRWAYESEVGAISPVMFFEDKCVVARLAAKNKKGEMADISTFRGEIEAQIRRKKQVEQIASKAKSASNLQAVASMFNSEVKDADSIKMMGMSNPDLGYEPKVLSAAVNPGNVNKLSAPIPGQTGVFFITVKAITDNMKNVQRLPQMERMQLEGQYMNSIEQFLPIVLKKRATITDNRNVSLNY
jgi:peptidyl-prolyl cis-trans isomerase D